MEGFSLLQSLKQLSTDKEEAAKKAEAAKIAEAAKKAEAAKLAEAAKKAEAAKIAEAAKKAEAAKLAEDAKTSYQIYNVETENGVNNIGVPLENVDKFDQYFNDNPAALSEMQNHLQKFGAIII